MTQREIDLIWYSKILGKNGFEMSIESINTIRVWNPHTGIYDIFDNTDEFVLWAKENA